MLILTNDKTGGRQRFAGRLIQIGRVAENDLSLPVSHISSRHARIRREADTYFIADLGSTNGTCVERAGRRLLLGPKGAADLPLESGDVLVLGDIDRPERWLVEIAVEPAALSSTTIVARRDASQTQAAARRVEGSGEGALLPALLVLVEALASSTSPADVLARVAQAALDTIADAVDALVVASRPGAGPSPAFEVLARAERPGGGVSNEPDAAICQHVLARGEALLFGRGSAELPAATLVSRGLGGGVCAPLLREGRCVGVLQVNCAADSQVLGAEALDLAIVLAHHAAVALQKAELVERLRVAEAALREENAFLRRRSQGEVEIVAASPKTRAVLAELDKVAATDVTVLLSGETGTGKEVAARRVHERSRRAERLLVPVNCGALAETLLDSELFGHKKGAFTGAASDRKGVFEMAAGGTVFLDEIGETPPAVQVRLLRVLEEGKIKRVGETVERSVDVRVIAATNRDLAKMVEAGSFRRDLYYRLRVFPVELPPLRERKEDIAPLAEHFARRFAARIGKSIAGVDPSLLDALACYSFPGNVRELANELERAVVRAASGSVLGAELLSEDVLSAGDAAAAGRAVGAANGGGGTLRAQIDAFERTIIERTLDRHDRRKASAAAELGLSRQGLVKKMARLGVG